MSFIDWKFLQKNAANAASVREQRDRAATSLAQLEGEIKRLEAGAGTDYRAANFDPTALAALIRDRKDEAETARAILAGLENELTETTKRETTAALEARSKQGRAIQMRLQAAYVQFHEGLALATAGRELVIRERVALAAINSDLRDGNREDLEVEDPLHILGQKMKRVYFDPQKAMIADYFPHPHPEGPFLASMKNLKL